MVDLKEKRVTVVYRRVANLIPKKIVGWLGSRFVFAGVDDDPREKAGEWLLVSFLYSLAPLVYYMVLYHRLQTVWTPGEMFVAADLFAITFIVFIAVYYLKMYYGIRKRTVEMEKILPDFLSLIVSNLRAGMTPWDAFTRATRPEFGALHEEVRRVSTLVSAEAPLGEALAKLSSRFESKLLARTVKLFDRGARSGGRIAKLLSASAHEIRAVQDMRAELIVATQSYTIFLAFIVIFLMPFLLAVSTHFISVFTDIGQQTAVAAKGASVGGVVLMGGNVMITAQEMFFISIGTLVATGFLVSLLSGIISSGKALDGVRYFPWFAIASCVLYVVSRMLLGNVMAQFS